MRHIIPISGKDSCCTAILQITRDPTLPYELMFNDVGAELPETYQWLEKVETTLGRKIIRIGKSLEQIINHYDILPAPKVRFCTREGKIEPMEEYIGENDATIYFGIRADEDRVGFQTNKRNIIPCFPLKDLGVTLPMVYQILRSKNITPPKFFWQRLYDRVISKLRSRPHGFGLAIDPVDFFAALPEWMFDKLFSWRSRSNCFFCFFQTMSEWAGLLEHHPELFNKAEQIEQSVAGGDEREKPFTWIANCPLDKIRRERDKIFAKRVNRIIKFIQTKRIDRDPTDLLSVTSCGLFCGK